MIRPIPPVPAEHPEAALYPCLRIPAVAHCSLVWQKIHAATLQLTKNIYTSERCAGKAFRLAMPPLSGYRNICDFIACVGYGMLIGAIKNENGTKLMYAAQVALSAVPKEDKTRSLAPNPESLIPNPCFHAAPSPIPPYPKAKKRVRPRKPRLTLPDKGVTAASTAAITTYGTPGTPPPPGKAPPPHDSTAAAIRSKTS